MLKVYVNFVDGSAQDWTVGDEILKKYRILSDQGMSGRALVHELFTDDWGVPPQSIEISGKTKDGESVKITLDYPRERSGGGRRR
jgi:hypothetical protein